MIFEFLTTTIFGGIAIKAYMKKQNFNENDSGKIQRIISLSGLNVKDGKDTLTTQLVSKKQHDWGWEYKFRIPLGRSFDDYLAKQKVIADGLNNRSKQITLNDLKSLNFDAGIITSLRSLCKNRLTDSKEIELDFDGLLIIRVYNEPMPKQISFAPGMKWKVPVGITRDKNKFKYHDFEIVPHLVLGGATRYGKSNFINCIIISLIQSQSENVHFYFIDLKGGVELCDYECIKQTESIAYEPQEALETLKIAYERMIDLQQQLKAKGKKNVQQAGIKDRYFVIVDEVGELNPSEAVTPDEKKLKQECQRIMSQISRIGAGLGFRLITATQYPTGDVIPRQVKQNSDAKLSFRVQSQTASRVVLDEPGAELLPQIRGRAIYQSADKREIVQTPMMNSKIIEDTIKPHIRIVEDIQQEEAQNAIESKTVITKARIDTVTFEEV